MKREPHTDPQSQRGRKNLTTRFDCVEPAMLEVTLGFPSCVSQLIPLSPKLAQSWVLSPANKLDKYPWMVGRPFIATPNLDNFLDFTTDRDWPCL